MRIFNKHFLVPVVINRPSNAPHRSLPDIPVSDPNQLDTNSDLYATVGDKVGEKPQGRSRECNTIKILFIKCVISNDRQLISALNIRNCSNGQHKETD